MKLRHSALAVVAALTILPGAPRAAAAQAPSSTWFGAVFYDGDYFTGSSPVWTDWWTIRAMANRAFGGATVGLEATTTHRFALTDQSVAVDAYVDLWQGAYVHLRSRVAPGAELLPLSDWRGEIFHALPGGWEASANLWVMNLSGPDVETAGLGLARYVSQWYLRGRASLAEIAGRHAGAVGVFARRFLGDSRQYFELGGGTGEEVVILGAGPLLEARRTWFLAGSFQRFLFEPLGVHLSAGLNDFEGVPLRRHLTVGLISRF